MKIIVTRYEPIKHYVKENAPKMDIVWNDHPEQRNFRIHSFGNPGFKSSKKDYEEYAGCCFMFVISRYYKKKVCRSFLKAFIQNPKGIHMCVTKKRGGNPVIFPKQLFDELMGTHGRTRRKAGCQGSILNWYIKCMYTKKRLSDMDYKEDKINLEKRTIKIMR